MGLAREEDGRYRSEIWLGEHGADLRPVQEAMYSSSPRRVAYQTCRSRG